MSAAPKRLEEDQILGLQANRRGVGGRWLALLGVVALSGRLAAIPAAGPAAPAPATSIVAAALKSAAAERKIVLIEFGASWCKWCSRFDAFVRAPGVSPIVAANYIVVNLVVQERDDKTALENPGGQDVMNQWGGGSSGLPFYVFLDASGRKIADSNAMPGGKNVGFPGNKTEAAVFLNLLDQTAPRLKPADRATIVGYLESTVTP